MLDEKSLKVITRFKRALLTRDTAPPSNLLDKANRGRKLTGGQGQVNTLTPKVVEYEGSKHVVLTNEIIERTNYVNKRRWLSFYRQTPREAKDHGQNGADKTGASDLDGSDADSGSGSDADGSESDEDESQNPFKRLRLSDILAPLRHPAEVYTHPAISKTFKLASLANMAAEIIEVIEIEQNTLNKLNNLIQVLDGEDWYYQLEENMGLPPYDHGLDEDKTGEKADRAGAEATDKTAETAPSEPAPSVKEEAAQPEAAKDDDASTPKSEPEDFKRITRMTLAAAPDPLPESVTDPFFMLPKALALYDERLRADAPDELATVQQELVSYLQVSIQRQHEYIRNLQTIRGGLVKADRYMRDIYKWGKEMSEKK